ncbi:MAG: hypothetical protein GX774_09235 [Armatimonadetes bacterium]|jgi:hypothetical protein|nr:hypothetical protein [Armatimonadota bacterium]
MSRRPAAIGRFVIEILVPEEEVRPTSGGMLVALEEGLRQRGYEVRVRSVTPVPGVQGWRPTPEEPPKLAIRAAV